MAQIPAPEAPEGPVEAEPVLHGKGRRGESASPKAKAEEFWWVARRVFFRGENTHRFFNVMSRPGIAAFISVLGLVLGIVVSLWGVEIRDRTRALPITIQALWAYIRAPQTVDAPEIDVAWLTLFFWFALGVWSRLLYLRLITDERKDKERLELLNAHVRDLQSTIFRAPNPNFIAGYEEFFDRTVEQIQNVREVFAQEPTNPELRIKAREEQVRAVLHTTVSLVHAFSGTMRGVTYTANVMVFVPPTGDPDQLFPPPLWEHLKFFDTGNADPRNLIGLLTIPPELASTSPKAVLPPSHNISLPVPKRPQVGDLRYALPGGPWCFHKQKMSVYGDTWKLADQWPFAEKIVQGMIRNHFRRGGEGEKVRSFASLPIVHGKRRLGVLNIDSDHPFVLGPAEEYHTTFSAAMRPLLHLLAEPLQDYLNAKRIRGSVERRGSPPGTQG